MSENALHTAAGGWDAWYEETEPERRMQMLPGLIASQEDDGMNAWRLKLFGIRHALPLRPDGTAEKAPAQEERGVDRYLWQFVNFAQIARTSRLLRFLGRKEVIKTLRELGISQAAQDGPAGEEAAYREVRNATYRFLRSCQSETYGRSLFGLVPSTKKERRAMAREEINKVTDDLTRRLGLEQELALWTRAVCDAYAAFSEKESTIGRA